MKITTNFIKQTKRHLCASGSILLPLAQKWGLVGAVAICALSVLGARSASAASLSISVPGNLSVDVQPGGPAKESVSEGFTVTSDAYWGYTLSVKSNNAEGALTNGVNKISSIGDSVTNLNQFTNNTWGFKVSGEGVTNTNYRQGPTTSTIDLATTTGKKGGQETGTYSFTLAAKVDNTIPTGAYTGTFTFMATANVVDYTINFDIRNGTGGPSTMGGQTENATVKLASSVPVNGDHVFLGWCDQEVIGSEPCKGIIYQPDDNYKLNSANGSTTLYALYDGDTVYMQNWKGCTKYLTKNTQFTLTDKRDNREYYVAKLADGNCWMTENLDLFLDKNIPLTPESSDVKKEWTPPTTYTDSTWNAENEAGSIGQTMPQSYEPGDKCWNKQNQPTGSLLPAETYLTNCPKHDKSHYHLGNYYNYAAAVAQDDTSDHVKDGDFYESSICPAGWQLPTFNKEKSYEYLQTAIESDDDSPNWVVGYIDKNNSGQSSLKESTIHEEPYFLTYNGYWRGAYLGVGYWALYRTNAVSSSTGSHAFNFNANGLIEPQIWGGHRKDGFPVRCVSRN